MWLVTETMNVCRHCQDGTLNSYTSQAPSQHAAQQSEAVPELMLGGLHDTNTLAEETLSVDVEELHIIGRRITTQCGKVGYVIYTYCTFSPGSPPLNQLKMFM